jgi:hypothetical protein
MILLIYASLVAGMTGMSHCTVLKSSLYIPEDNEIKYLNSKE